MGLNYKKRIKVAPGVHVNLGKKSAGVSFGGKYAGVSINSKSGTSVRASAPGTGVSYRKNLSTSSHRAAGHDVQDVQDYDLNRDSEDTTTATEPLFLDAETVASLNQAAFLSYADDVIAYCKTIDRNVDVDTFTRAQDALHIVRAELKRRDETKATSKKAKAIKSKEPKAAEPKKPSYFDTLTPEQKARGKKISAIVIVASAILGVTAAALHATGLATVLSAVLLVSIYCFAKTK